MMRRSSSTRIGTRTPLTAIDSRMAATKSFGCGGSERIRLERRFCFDFVGMFPPNLTPTLPPELRKHNAPNRRRIRGLHAGTGACRLEWPLKRLSSSRRLYTEGLSPLPNLNELKKKAAELASALGQKPVEANWSGIDSVLPALEAMANDGSVVVIKLDGQRKPPKDNGRYTVLVSGGKLGEDFFRIDTAVLEEGLAAAILRYCQGSVG